MGRLWALAGVQNRSRINYIECQNYLSMNRFRVRVRASATHRAGRGRTVGDRGSRLGSSPSSLRCSAPETDLPWWTCSEGSLYSVAATDSKRRLEQPCTTQSVECPFPRTTSTSYRARCNKRCTMSHARRYRGNRSSSRRSTSGTREPSASPPDFHGSVSSARPRFRGSARRVVRCFRP
jgi:hypothetical protein